MSFGLTAGLRLAEIRRLTPGMIIDLYLLRRRYDDDEHFIKRER